MKNMKFMEEFYYFKLNEPLVNQQQKMIFNSLKKEDPLLLEACQLLTREFIEEVRFDRQTLSREIIKERFNRGITRLPVIDLVLNTFHENRLYTESYIKQELNNIYKIAQLEREAKATDISRFFETSKRRTVNKQGEKGYLLLNARYSLSGNNPRPEFKETNTGILLEVGRQFIAS